MAIIYLGLGSNLGNRKDNIRKAVLYLKAHDIKIRKLSTIIETEPVGGPKQRKFFNAVLKGETKLLPEHLLKILKSIEKTMGRKKTVTNGPRPIDIDILLYGKRCIKKRNLIIPHPRMFERDFVIRPLKEIAPHLIKKPVHENHPNG